MDPATLCFMMTGVAVMATPVVVGLGLLHLLRETAGQIQEDAGRNAADRLFLLPGWSAAAQTLGLRVLGPHHMEGEAVGRPVRIRRQDAWLTVELVVPETRLEAALREEPTPGVVVTGDTAFDTHWRTSVPSYAPEVLHKGVRAALMDAATLGPVTVQGGYLRVRVPDEDAPVPAILDALSALDAVADQVLHRGPTALAMAIDPDEPTPLRLAAIRTLDGCSTADAAVLEGLLDDPDESIRWATAIAVRDVDALLSLVADPSAPAPLRIEAATGLGEAHREAAVAAFVASDDPILWQSAASTASQHPTDALTRLLLPLFGPDRIDLDTWRPETSNRQRLIVQLGRALTAAPVEGVEAPLSRMLQHTLPAVLRDRVLQLLAAQGTVDQVPVLRAVQQAASRDLARRIEATIVEIQTQSGGQAGTVSIAQADALQGAVSVALPTQVAKARQPEGS